MKPDLIYADFFSVAGLVLEEDLKIPTVISYPNSLRDYAEGF